MTYRKRNPAQYTHGWPGPEPPAPCRLARTRALSPRELTACAAAASVEATLSVIAELAVRPDPTSRLPSWPPKCHGTRLRSSQEGACVAYPRYQWWFSRGPGIGPDEPAVVVLVTAAATDEAKEWQYGIPPIAHALVTTTCAGLSHSRGGSCRVIPGPSHRPFPWHCTKNGSPHAVTVANHESRCTNALTAPSIE